MHEKFRRRLEALEEARRLQDGPPQMISIGFVNPDKTPIAPTVAWTGDFKCWRLEGEDEDAFRARAHAECRAADPRPVQILIFSDDKEQRQSGIRSIVGAMNGDEKEEAAQKAGVSVGEWQRQARDWARQLKDRAGYRTAVFGRIYNVMTPDA